MPLYNSQGQIFPIQAITEGGGQGGGHSGTPSGAGAPHGSVFFRKKKKTGCKHKLYFLEKECVFPTCLFIYKSWEHWVPWLWGTWAPSGTAVLSVCASSASGGPWPTAVSRLGTERLPSVTNGFGCLKLVSCLALTHSACQKPLSPPFLSFLACFIGSQLLI